MDQALKNLFGLAEGGKRVYNIQEGEVSVDEFEYCVAMDYLLFGKEGLADTLGPTWNMTLDPRFFAVEAATITNKRPVFGGDARQGVQHQLSDGSFASSLNDLEAYSEIIGEGRYFHGALKGAAYEAAIQAIFPGLTFDADTLLNATTKEGKHEYRTGLTMYSLLTSDQQAQVDVEVCKLKYAAFNPVTFHTLEDHMLWDLIREQAPGYFSKAGEPNETAQQLFRLFRADLLGLIDTYAELPKLDEWVAADGSGTLVDRDADPNEETPMVYYEVDMIERALGYRAQLRSVAVRVLKLTGAEGFITKNNIQLTELERDQLVRLVFQTPTTFDDRGVPVFGLKWPDDRTAITLRVLSFLNGITALGQGYEAREARQLVDAAQNSQAFIAGVKSGTVQQITRHTEPVVEVADSPEAKMMESILNDPIKLDLFLRFTAAEKNGDADVVATLAPVFATDDYEVSEETYYALVAETTALLRARAKAMGAEAPVPLSHLGEDNHAPVTDVDAPQLLADLNPSVIELPDFPTGGPTAIDPFLGEVSVEEAAWWVEHPGYVMRRTDTAGKRSAIRIAQQNPEEPTGDTLAALTDKNHAPAPRLEAALTRDASLNKTGGDE